MRTGRLPSWSLWAGIGMLRWTGFRSYRIAPSGRHLACVPECLRPRVGRRAVSKVEWHAGELFARVGFIATNRTDPAKGVVRFYNGRGTCKQWISEGKHAVEWTRLSCHAFERNAVRLALFVPAYNLGNFLRRLVLPKEMARRSLTSLGERLVKIGARLTRHARRLALRMAEVAITRDLFAQIPSRIRSLSPVPT